MLRHVLRTADGVDSDGGGTAADVDPVLMNDQSDTSTAMPILPPDEYRLQIVKIEQVRNKADTGNVLKVNLKTTEDTIAVGGEPVKAGFPIFHNISITPTADYLQSSINRSLKALMVAAGFETGAFYPLDRYTGKVVRAKVKVQAATAEWEESNKISRFVV